MIWHAICHDENFGLLGIIFLGGSGIYREVIMSKLKAIGVSFCLLFLFLALSVDKVWGSVLFTLADSP
jgi:hypothetical protein